MPNQTRNIKRILIPNRGEIAVRIIKTAQKLGIETVVTLAEIEKESLPATLATQVHFWESDNLAESFLNIDKIIEVAKKYRVDAIHPGYGFLSENHLLAEACLKNNLVFIGPSANHLLSMGNKINARKIAIEAGIPVIPDWQTDNLPKESDYPVIIKAALGGGGKGMKRIDTPEQLISELSIVTNEAKRYFGEGAVFIEKFIDSPRHIEVQILGDQHNHTIHLGERECSIQRRFQKIVEETPAIGISQQTRKNITRDALKLVTKLGYFSAGTVEFLVDQQGNHYFLEMNTRIQVEHGITELITGIDLIEQQIKIASGQHLEIAQNDISFTGHAIEVRVCAENPANNFAPSPGELTSIHYPSTESMRVDNYFIDQTVVHPQYDPMLFKLMVHANNRKEAITELTAALHQTAVIGVETNLAYLQNICQHPQFLQSNTHTSFCQTHHQQLIKPLYDEGNLLPYLPYLIDKLYCQNTSNNVGHWRIIPQLTIPLSTGNQIVEYQKNETECLFISNHQTIKVSNIEASQNRTQFTINNEHFTAFWESRQPMVSYTIHQHKIIFVDNHTLPPYTPLQKLELNDVSNSLHAPIPGILIRIEVKAGDTIKKGDTLAVIDAMKTENHLRAWKDATIEAVHVTPGTHIKSNDLILTTNNE